MSFYLDSEFRSPLFRARDSRYNPLGEWVIIDVARFFLVCLDALAMIDDVVHGREPFEEWSSDNYQVVFTAQGLTVANNWVENWGGTYPIQVVREVVEEYWRFLVAQPERDVIREYRPDLPEWEASVLRWEEKWNRTHPYRGRFR